jgi:endoglucanase
MTSYTMIGFLIAALLFTDCKKKETGAPELTVAPSEISLPSEGGTADLTITGNSNWTVSNAASPWMQLSQTSGNSGSGTIRLTAALNITFVTKQAIVHGLKPFWWDTGGALDRQNYTVKDQRTIDALIAGGK